MCFSARKLHGYITLMALQVKCQSSKKVHITSDLGFNKGGCVIQIKLSVNTANPCSKFLCTEVREVYQIFRKQTLDV